MKTVVIFLVFLITIEGQAQVHSAFGVTVNAGYWRVPSLRSPMTSATGDSIHYLNGFPKVGVEIFYFHERVVLNASGYFGFQPIYSDQKKFIEPFMWSTHGAFGWIVFNENNVQVYPGAGFGVTGIDLSTYEWSSERTISEMKVTAPTVDLSIAVNLLLINRVAREQHDGIVLNAKIGYMRSLSDVRWQSPSDNNKVITPAQFQGLHFSISISGAGLFMCN